MGDVVDEARDARNARIRQLEAKLEKPPPTGVSPLVTATGLAASIGLLASIRADATYFFSAKAPIDLGAEGGYHFERAVSNRYAQIHGAPTVRGAYWLDGDTTMVAVGVRDTPLLISRAALPTEPWRAGNGTPPQPDQRPFQVRGRLMHRSDVPALDEAFARHATWGEVKADWVVLAEARPGSDVMIAVWLLLLSTMALVSAWLLLRSAVGHRRRRRSTASS